MHFSLKFNHTALISRTTRYNFINPMHPPGPAITQAPALREATGHAHAPILDYAGPSSRGKFRLPAQSILRVDTLPDRLAITETLAGQSGAFAAILFALFTLFTLGGATLHGVSARHFSRHIPDLIVCASFATVEISLMLAVIQNTWRKTVLLVTPTELTLRFWAPFTGRRHHVWPPEKLHDAHIRFTRTPNGRAEFPELELDLWGEPQVRLFLGHPQRQLEAFVREIQRLQPPAEVELKEA